MSDASELTTRRARGARGPGDQARRRLRLRADIGADGTAAVHVTGKHGHTQPASGACDSQRCFACTQAKDLPTVQTAAAPAKEIKVQQRGQRVGGEKAYCEDCGTAKATMGDPRTNSSPEARDGVRRWCERCCTYLNQRPGAAPTDPFAAGWTYSRKIFKPYGAQFASKETDWPKNGWTYPNTAPVPRTDGRPSFVKEDTSVASSCRIDPDPLATADLIQNIRPAELRPIRPSGLAAVSTQAIFNTSSFPKEMMLK